ncbi:HEPN domain-containing protein [Candidatus Pacearchaeota archaeon]|nr:HEPN domain-containing protein [Candidatus Pacearchaeota archaeon]
MVKNREDLYRWSIEKAEEYLQSASANLKSERFYPAAEEIFRVVETSLEAMLYHYGIRKIEYPGRKKFTGRLALQFLIRDSLLKMGRIDSETYDWYLDLATELHKAGYTHGRSFEKKFLEDVLLFAEDLFYRAKSLG